MNSNRKNAADDKLKDLMRRFADAHGTDSSIILISGQHIFLVEPAVQTSVSDPDRDPEGKKDLQM